MSGKPKYKVASIIPIDGQPSMPHWYDTIKDVDYPIAMSIIWATGSYDG